MQIFNPLNIPEWERLLFRNQRSSFFHTSVWARVLHESYGYRPVYLASIKDNTLEAFLPLMEVSSFLTGKRAVSLPFTDYCSPVLSDNAGLQAVMPELVDLGNRSGWKYIEIRGGGPGRDMDSAAFHFGHVLDISKGEDSLFTGLRDSTRRNIRKAEREGVEVRISNSSESLAEFYSLNCMTRKMHGLPPQPYRFFRKLHEHALSRGFGMIALAGCKGKTVAASVNLHFRDKAIFKYGASDSRYNHLRANNLVMWEAIKWYARNGFREFCFGRTEPENEGLLQFKRGWGADEYNIDYYKYALQENSFIKERSRLHGFHNRIFSNMPIPMLRLAGTLLYRHMG